MKHSNAKIRILMFVLLAVSLVITMGACNKGGNTQVDNSTAGGQNNAPWLTAQHADDPASSAQPDASEEPSETEEPAGTTRRKSGSTTTKKSSSGKTVTTKKSSSGKTTTKKSGSTTTTTRQDHTNGKNYTTRDYIFVRPTKATTEPTTKPTTEPTTKPTTEPTTKPTTKPTVTFVDDEGTTWNQIDDD